MYERPSDRHEVKELIRKNKFTSSNDNDATTSKEIENDDGNYLY